MERRGTRDWSSAVNTHNHNCTSGDGGGENDVAMSTRTDLERSCWNWECTGRRPFAHHRTRSSVPSRRLVVGVVERIPASVAAGIRTEEVAGTTRTEQAAGMTRMACSCSGQLGWLPRWKLRIAFRSLGLREQGLGRWVGR